MSQEKKGKATRLKNCCREIRLAGAFAKRVGEVLTGFNTLTEQPEKWQVLKINKRDYNENVLQQIKGKALKIAP